MSSELPLTPEQREKLFVVNKLIELGNPRVETVRGRDFPIVDFIAMAEWYLVQLQAAKAEAEQDMQISNMEWRIEQWRRARKYMLNDTWQPMFDELCAEMDRLKATPKEDKETE